MAALPLCPRRLPRPLRRCPSPTSDLNNPERVDSTQHQLLCPSLKDRIRLRQLRATLLEADEHHRLSLHDMYTTASMHRPPCFTFSDLFITVTAAESLRSVSHSKYTSALLTLLVPHKNTSRGSPSSSSLRYNKSTQVQWAVPPFDGLLCTLGVATSPLQEPWHCDNVDQRRHRLDTFIPSPLLRLPPSEPLHLPQAAASADGGISSSLICASLV
ncbi:hypothetical protein BHE74_00022380 [Ensete ventricosum]|nr:hypothetical protein BHE74_00022380 [Ensete ventricosum]